MSAVHRPDLHGHSAVVAGGACGIGAAVARILVEVGIGVVVAEATFSTGPEFVVDGGAAAGTAATALAERLVS
ncbi:hypothetical protein [Nocardia sp. CA-135398]|uniref:hypothetical protein n=1 Tax=Nocardia sp. CA-135398 TaxID=3239977 RepID=UPI003D976CDB